MERAGTPFSSNTGCAKNKSVTMFQPLVIFTLAVTTLLLFWLLVVRRIWVEKSSVRTMVVNGSLSLFTVAYLFVVLEIMFATIFVASDGFGFTLLSKRWFEKYWAPINAHGYRDYDHSWKDKVLFVVGDSFVAGHGIKDISDRFAGVLAEKLNEDWSVAVIAQNGWDSASELEAIAAHPQRPTRIIVSHFVNDIEAAARANGITRPKQITKPNAIIKPLVDRSFVLNWLYWRVYRRDSGDSYVRYLSMAHANPAVIRAHEKELGRFLEYANAVGADIAFVVWPLLINVPESRQFTAPIVEYLRRHNVLVVDLQEHFSDRMPEELIVNAADAHPNVEVNAEVADLLYAAMAPWD